MRVAILSPTTLPCQNSNEFKIWKVSFITFKNCILKTKQTQTKSTQRENSRIRSRPCKVWVTWAMGMEGHVTTRLATIHRKETSSHAWCNITRSMCGETIHMASLESGSLLSLKTVRVHSVAQTSPRSAASIQSSPRFPVEWLTPSCSQHRDTSMQWDPTNLVNSVSPLPSKKPTEPATI